MSMFKLLQENHAVYHNDQIMSMCVSFKLF